MPTSDSSTNIPSAAIGAAGRARKGVAAALLDRAEIVRQGKYEATALIEQAESLAIERMQAVEAAKERVEGVVAEARQQGYEAGFNEGRKAGYEAGRAEGMAALKDVLSSVEGILAETKNAQWDILDEARQDLVKLAIAVAARMVGHALSDERAVAESILSRLLPHAEGTATARIRIPESTLAAFGDEPLRDAIRDGRSFEIVADESLTPGDVVIETDWGLVDGRLASRWRRLLEGLELLEDSGVVTEAD